MSKIVKEATLHIKSPNGHHQQEINSKPAKVTAPQIMPLRKEQSNGHHHPPALFLTFGAFPTPQRLSPALIIRSVINGRISLPTFKNSLQHTQVHNFNWPHNPTKIITTRFGQRQQLTPRDEQQQQQRDSSQLKTSVYIYMQIWIQCSCLCEVFFIKRPISLLVFLNSATIWPHTPILSQPNANLFA